MTPSPDYIRGQRDGMKRAAEYHDAKAAKWRKEARRHKRPGGYRSDCEQRDLDRAERHEADAVAIRAEAAKLPKASWPRKEPRDA